MRRPRRCRVPARWVYLHRRTSYALASGRRRLDRAVAQPPGQLAFRARFRRTCAFTASIALSERSLRDACERVLGQAAGTGPIRHRRREAPYAQQLVTAAKNPPMSKPTAINMAVATAPVARYGIGRRPASESLPDDQMTTSMAICTTTTMMSAVAAGGTLCEVPKHEPFVWFASAQMNHASALRNARRKARRKRTNQIIDSSPCVLSGERSTRPGIAWSGVARLRVRRLRCISGCLAPGARFATVGSIRTAGAGRSRCRDLDSPRSAVPASAPPHDHQRLSRCSRRLEALVFTRSMVDAAGCGKSVGADGCMADSSPPARLGAAPANVAMPGGPGRSSLLGLRSWLRCRRALAAGR